LGEPISRRYDAFAVMKNDVKRENIAESTYRLEPA
jgi:hypothetical protein